MIKIAPESMEVANAYLETGSADAAAAQLGLSKEVVHTNLAKREVKSYLDQIYLDQGYRNRFRLADIMDRMIEKKLEEAEESDMYSSKDLADLVLQAHKMRQDELKANDASNTIRQQNNVLITDGGMGLPGGNYGKLMEKLLSDSS